MGVVIAVEHRIAEKVAQTAGGCLQWTAYLEDGYARIWFEGAMVRVHRLVWELSNGCIPSGMEIDHLCHNRACCNLAHLRLVSHAQNGQNRSGAPDHSTTGVRGVRLHPNGKYQVRVAANGQRYSGGYFRDLDDAARAAVALRARMQDPIPALPEG